MTASRRPRARIPSSALRTALRRLERMCAADCKPVPCPVTVTFNPAEAAFVAEHYAAYALQQIEIVLAKNRCARIPDKAAKLIYAEVLHSLDVMLASLLEHQCGSTDGPPERMPGRRRCREPRL